MSYKQGRLASTRFRTQQMLYALDIPHKLYWSTGCFSIELGQETMLQYWCSTGKWGWYERNDLPIEHRDSTPKQFYEQVLACYVEDPPEWKELKVRMENIGVDDFKTRRLLL